MSDERNDMQAVIEAAREAGRPETLDPDQPQAILLPEGAQLVKPDLREWRSRPTRKTGIYRPATVEAFIAYVEQHLETATSVWVHPTSGQIVAVINDHSSEPGWGDHRAVLQLDTTPEWKYWASADGDMVGQEAFAEHIEGGLEEIVEPDAAVMLEIAQSFHATTSATFRSSTRLASGEQRFQYDEELSAKAGMTGEMTMPTAMLLAIAPFVGEDRYKIAARLRFRIHAGKLTLGYKLDRPESVKRDALGEIAHRLAEKFALTYVGEPAV